MNDEPHYIPIGTYWMETQGDKVLRCGEVKQNEATMTDQEGLAILRRLRRLHAQALELYMLRRLKGEDAEVQKKRLLWIAGKISIYELF